MSDPLTRQQRDAIGSRERDILVEAGAGTGKTRTTVDRYLNLLEGGLEPSQILVFTFTDKAANELRERVRSEKSEDPSFSMSSAWIGTFHAICGAILRSHPIQADVDPSFEILDDIRAERLKSSAYDSALREFMDTPEREETIARFTPSHLRTGVSRAFEQLRSRGQTVPRLPVPAASDPVRMLTELRNDAAYDLQNCGAGKPILEKISGLIEVLDSKEPADLRFADYSLGHFSSTSKYIQPLVKTMEECRLAIAAAEFGDVIREDLGLLIQAYGERYAELKRDSNVLDFDDLQLQTLELMRSDESIAASYSGRFAEIMVDEFQDTNQLQLDLIEALRNDETRLFTVGDEMQAIYGFRHADVQLFRARRDCDDVTVLPLSANVRSQAPVIASVNAVGRALDGQVEGPLDDTEKSLRQDFADLEVGLEPEQYEGDEVEMSFTEPEGWAELELGPISPALNLDLHDVPATTGSHQGRSPRSGQAHQGNPRKNGHQTV
ncbi:MAG: UvrD-helicase domain-containing protein [Solirubrobacterales bacterium]|nr:UvrD-helicase domain-containing protein [Solirubrobacterales bacterium]